VTSPGIGGGIYSHLDSANTIWDLAGTSCNASGNFAVIGGSAGFSCDLQSVQSFEFGLNTPGAGGSAGVSCTRVQQISPDQFLHDLWGPLFDWGRLFA